MHHDHWTDQLSAFLDNDLPREQRLALEGHLLNCQTCRDTLRELRAVVVAARSLVPAAPVGDLWPAIARELGRSSSGVSRRHVRVPLVGAIAAGVLLALTSSMTAWLMLHRPAPANSVTAAGEPSLRPVGIAPVQYGDAVDDLMGTLASRRGQLNPRTLEVLERSLATIDRAIADAVAVLREYPDDLALVQRVAEQRRMKLAVLRQVERLTAAPEP
jgi:anti-sigma factor RsiW